MTSLEILKAARAKIVQGWTQGYLACDASGKPVESCSESAVCWCMTGALQTVSLDLWVLHPAVMALKSVLPGERGYTISAFNDRADTTKEDVLKAFDAAIAKVEGRR